MKEEEDIKNMIYEINGVQIMLDSDLAKLYECKNGTKEINQAVNRNIGKFPNRFSWQLNKKETNVLQSQIVTTNIMSSMSRTYHRVFTEQGIAMIATILKSNKAIEISIKIMDAFVVMRHIMSNKLLTNNIEYKLLDHDKRIDLLEQTFAGFKEATNYIYFEGQIYDAYSKIIDIMSKAKQEIIIIDNYADKTVLDMISRMKVRVLLITKSNGLLKKLDIEKYNKEYSNLEIIYNNTFHDRYIVLDRNTLYHLGSSLNHIGNKTFSINRIEESSIIKLLLDKIKKI